MRGTFDLLTPLRGFLRRKLMTEIFLERGRVPCMLKDLYRLMHNDGASRTYVG